MSTPLPPSFVVGQKVSAAWLNLVAEWIASAGGYQSYTPTLTADTTNPNLGAGGKRLGKYRQIGNAIHAQGMFVFGTSGTSGGSGSYAIGMPVTAAAALGTGTDPAMLIGNGWLSANGYVAPINIVQFSSGGIHMHYYPTLGTRAIVGSGAPGGWTVGDFIVWDVEYEAA